jgi:glycosyltransferase involved in cell wall biosynthesis
MTRRACLVGPAYPYRGGIAHYNSLLAREFAKDHDVLVVNFKRLYPSVLFPGKTQLDESGEPLSVASVRVIDSLDPTSYWRAARRIAYLCHNVMPHETSPVDRALIKLGLGRADAFLVQSEEDRSRLLRVVRNAKVAVNPHPIYDVFNRGRYTKERAREELGVSGRVLLFFGYVRPYKGVGVLLDAFAEIVRRMEAVLFVVGEIYEGRERYAALVKQLGIENRVRMIDRYVANEEVEKYFAAADLVVLPYLSATQSGVVQVAYGFDKPVVVTAVGGLSEAVEDGVTGYVVPPNDPAAVAGAVIRFFDTGVEQAMALGIGRVKERFSWERCKRALIGLVDENASRG